MNIKYPKNQHVILTFSNSKRPVFLVTREHINAGMYILYSIHEDGSVAKLKASATPLFKEIY